MIACPICQTQNHHLAVVCRSCGSFLQSKVETLDLFATVWRIIESPQKAFHRIAMATHKNYILVLGALSGIAFIFTVFWIVGIGNGAIPLMNILVAGFTIGPVLGIVNLLLMAFIQKVITGFFRLQAKYRNTLATIAYTCVPIVFSLIFLLPVKVLTYGKYFFSTNPSPWTLKPVSYVLLLGLDSIFFIWSVVLYAFGVKILYNVSLPRAMMISNMTIVTFVAIVCCFIMIVSSLQIESDVEKYFTCIFF